MCNMCSINAVLRRYAWIIGGPKSVAMHEFLQNIFRDTHRSSSVIWDCTQSSVLRLQRYRLPNSYARMFMDCGLECWFFLWGMWRCGLNVCSIKRSFDFPFTEFQKIWIWKGALDVIWSKFLLSQSPRAYCPGPWPDSFWISPSRETAQLFWETRASTQ